MLDPTSPPFLLAYVLFLCFSCPIVFFVAGLWSYAYIGANIAPWAIIIYRREERAIKRKPFKINPNAVDEYVELVKKQKKKKKRNWRFWQKNKPTASKA